MRKNLLFLFALICSMSLFTACNDDDKSVPPIEKELAGAYKGELAISVNEQALVSGLPQKVYISKSISGDDKLKLELKDFTFATLNLGNIQVDPCTVVEKDGGYDFAGSQTVELAAPIGTCPVTVSGTIKDGKIAIKISVKVDALGQDVIAAFEGTKLSGNEKTEAKITAFTFDDALVTEQPIIDDKKGTIVFKINDVATEADLKTLKPTIVASEKAVVIPASGVAQDFSGNKVVTYTVIAEDGTVNTYQVSVAGSQSVLKYSFEEWSEPQGGNYVYYNPLPTDELATPNKGVALLCSFCNYRGEYPVLQEEKGVNGKAVKLVTRYTKTTSTLPPTITAGSLFTGEMVMSLASLSKPLESTHFGIPYSKKPLYFKGYYKYSPGEVFRDGTNKGDVVVNDRVDECSIVAVLYQIENDADYLDGTNINTSESRVAIAQLADGTAKSEFTSFNIPFTYFPGKEYKPNAKYKIAIICSSSKEGDVFKGAPGSTLILDELEILGE